MVLIAPYATDPGAWIDLPWINRYSARWYRITIAPSEGYERAGVVTVKT
jgi:hypothetical protein